MSNTPSERLGASVYDELVARKSLELSGAANFSAKAFFIADLLSCANTTIVWIIEDDSVVDKIVNDLKLFTRETVIPLTNETAPEDMSRAVCLMHTKSSGVIVASHEAFSSMKVSGPKELNRLTTSISTKEALGDIELLESLINIGYKAADGDKVETEGSYVRRGDIIDIFPINSPEPIRLEYFGNTLEKMYHFNLHTNEPTQNRDAINILPLICENARSSIESFTENLITVLDEVEDKFKPKSKFTLRFTPFLNKSTESFHLDYKSVLRFHTPLEFTDDLEKKIKDHWNVSIFCKDRDRIWNFLVSKGFKDDDFDRIHIFGNGHLETWFTEEEKLHVPASNLKMPDGFSNTVTKTLVITEKEIFGSFAKTKERTKEQVSSAFLATLNEGDLVVHIDHGIGRFTGIERKEFSGIIREYLHLEYAEGDKLYIPVDQAEKVNKYIGVGATPTLTRLGSAEWTTITKKVHEEARLIAKELLDLYAKRMATKGFSASKESELQARFEADFPYNETPGQLKALQEIKADLESPTPMDRLLCGDVGFGKTEIAMRAAFKVLQNGKQVAFLAPITILADQHYKTCKKRMEPYSIRVEALSRFVPQKTQTQTVKDLAEGKVNLIVGTHRILQEDIEFKNLGLIIIDEEQRFGVKQKEKLKSMRCNVDILTLTATPIPRTLNMGLAGLRDISTITTPPPGRLPIHTEVRRFSYPLIRDAILREMERKGQAYVLHNRVMTIDSIAAKIKTLVPEARIIVAHGKLKPEELEKRILAFKQYKYDVLVSSTIIENGIDLPNANTLIVDAAENLGLAQAYQLRGRVGRGKSQAYCYFLYQSQKLKLDAKKRLKAIMESTELGSGFQIAMRDLEIRGAGDLLGAKQHGAINAIGVSHFTRLLNQAVEEYKSSKKMKKFAEEIQEINIDVSITAFLPDEYIPVMSDKLLYYQRLSGARDFDTLKEITTEIKDKYGQMPGEAKNLIRILELKIIARRAMVANIEEFNLYNKRYIDIILSSQVTPKAIVSLLDHNASWQITGSKLRILKSDLGENWLEELITCTKRLYIKRGWKQESHAPKNPKPKKNSENA